MLKSVLANEENGLPSFSNFTSEGWFSFVARPAHLDDEYKVPVSRALARPPSLARVLCSCPCILVCKFQHVSDADRHDECQVCARIDVVREDNLTTFKKFTNTPENFRYNPFFTCVRVQVLQHQARFVGATPAHYEVITSYVGVPLSLDIFVNSSIIKDVDPMHTPAEVAQMRDMPCDSRRSITATSCHVLTAGDNCTCATLSDGSGECAGTCQCMTHCTPGPLAVVTWRPDLTVLRIMTHLHI